MAPCAACGQTNPDGFRFCGACGASLVAPGGAPREERKVVTVLFCDLVGSTARAEALDPEDVRATLRSYHERVRHELERFGGTIEKYIGDAVMALFGAPVAHEDDPERAVRAAIAIRDRAVEDGDFRVRIGITTGEALVSLGARPETGEGMASGDVVNTAARLQTAAQANGILVDATTARATRRVIVFGERHPVAAKGKSHPVDAWDVQQARARIQVEAGVRGPLVGRAHELDVLRSALRRARTEAEPQLITLVGVPGIGKSRLVFELYRDIEAGNELTAWRQGRSPPYGEGLSFWALGEIVKAQAGILETDDEPAAAAKLSEVVASLAKDAEDASWLERHLRPLAGLEGSIAISADRRGEAFAAWRHFIEALAEVRPLVLVFEDLHFADDGLIDFVDHLIDWVGAVPVLVVATARPELLARRPGWGGGKANAITLSLRSMGDDETTALVDALLEGTPLAPAARSDLLARAGGNPLYAEEFARLVAEGGSMDELPETVHGLIAARIDGLRDDEKRLIQDAAVLGRVFWLGATAALSDGSTDGVEERLHALQRKEFVLRERRSSVSGESEYAFRHLLIRDVAYGQIPRAARAEKHRRAAAWLESLGRPADHAELLAHHYSSALELARAAGLPTGELARMTLHALDKAGDRAFALNAYSAAASHWERALALADGPGRGPLLLRHGQALALIGDARSQTVLAEAAQLAASAGDVEAAAAALADLSRALYFAGQRDGAWRRIDEATELLRDRPISPAQARVLSQRARLVLLAGDSDAALRIAQEAGAMAERLGMAELAAGALGTAGAARSRSGDQRGAIRDLQRSIDLALPIRSPEAARGHHNLHLPLWWSGELGRAVEACAEAVRVGERLGAHAQAESSRVALAWLLHLRGDWDDALDHAAIVVDAMDAGRAVYLEHQVRLLRARIHTARGESMEALDADLERAMELARTVRDPQVRFQVLSFVARIRHETGDTQAANAAAAELLTVLDEASSNALLLMAMDLAPAARALGVAEPLRRALDANDSIPDIWREPFAATLDGDYVRAGALLDRLGLVDASFVMLLAAEDLAAEGRTHEARDQLDAALERFRVLRAVRFVRRAQVLSATLATHHGARPETPQPRSGG